MICLGASTLGIVIALQALRGSWAGDAPVAPPASAARSGDKPAIDADAARAASTIVEFSDYECPYCAHAHRELRAALAARPHIRVEHRNFPLDQSCNPLVRRPLHRDACTYARAAICAGDQGRFREMNDALYANQGERRPVEELAARVGLDLVAFRGCLDAPRTARRLAEDIAAGARLGVSSTPTYVVGGVAYAGRLPADVFVRVSDAAR